MGEGAAQWVEQKLGWSAWGYVKPISTVTTLPTLLLLLLLSCQQQCQLTRLPVAILLMKTPVWKRPTVVRCERSSSVVASGFLQITT